MKNYYEKQAQKLLDMTREDAESQIKLIRKFNGDAFADKVIDAMFTLNSLKQAVEVEHV